RDRRRIRLVQDWSSSRSRRALSDARARRPSCGSPETAPEAIRDCSAAYRSCPGSLRARATRLYIAAHSIARGCFETAPQLSRTLAPAPTAPLAALAIESTPVRLHPSIPDRPSSALAGACRAL